MAIVFMAIITILLFIKKDESNIEMNAVLSGNILIFQLTDKGR